MEIAKMHLTHFNIFVLGSLLLLASPRASADATVYWDSDNGFDPSTVVIGPGENVTWWNVDPYGFDMTVTFTGGFNFHLPDYYGQEVAFPTDAGVYSYQNEWGNHGAVIVNVTPTVAITSPADNVVLPAPATFTVQATASDTADDYVSDVAFYLGTSDSTNLVEDVYAEPFITGLTNLDAGAYTLLAVATDSRGWSATNAITITVGAAAAVQLTSPRLVAGKFLFDVNGLTSGKTNIVQVSTNLASWSPVKTNIAASAAMTMTNDATVGKQFYRIFQWP